MYVFRMTSLRQSDPFLLLAPPYYNIGWHLLCSQSPPFLWKSQDWQPFNSLLSTTRDMQPLECHSQSIMFDSCGCFTWASGLSHKAQNAGRDCNFWVLINSKRSGHCCQVVSLIAPREVSAETSCETDEARAGQRAALGSPTQQWSAMWFMICVCIYIYTYYTYILWYVEWFNMHRRVWICMCMADT